MKKSMKRFLSTILALTMLCLCMVVMNISVFAAAVTVDFTSLSTDDTTYISDTLVNSGSNVNVYATSNGLTYKYNSGNGYVVVTGNSNRNTVDNKSTRPILKIVTATKGTISISASTSSNSTRNFYIYSIGSDNSTTTVLGSKETSASGSFTVDTNEDVAAGTYYFGSYNTDPVVYSLTFTASVATDTYTATGSLGEDNECTSGTFTLSDGTNDYTATVDSESNTYSAEISVEKGTTPLSGIKSLDVTAPSWYSGTTSVDVGTVDSENYTIELGEVSFTEIAGYSVAISAVSSEDSNTAVDVTLTSDNDNAEITGSGAEYTVKLPVGEIANITVASASTTNDYYNQTVAVSEESGSEITVTMKQVKGIEDGSNVLSIEKFGAPDGYVGEMTTNKQHSNCEIALGKGNVLQFGENRDRMRLVKEKVITYTPSVDGVLTINARPSGSSDSRYIIVTASDSSSVEITDSNGETNLYESTDSTYLFEYNSENNAYKDVSFDVSADVTYTITGKGNNIDVKTVTFTADNETVSGIDSDYVIFKLTSLTEDNISNYSSFDIVDSSGVSVLPSDADNTTVYTGVDFDGDGIIDTNDGDYEPSSGYVVAFKIVKDADSTSELSASQYAATLKIKLN